jgi:hypothetical protein
MSERFDRTGTGGTSPRPDDPRYREPSDRRLHRAGVLLTPVGRSAGSCHGSASPTRESTRLDRQPLPDGLDAVAHLPRPPTAARNAESLSAVAADQAALKWPRALIVMVLAIVAVEIFRPRGSRRRGDRPRVHRPVLGGPARRRLRSSHRTHRRGPFRDLRRLLGVVGPVTDNGAQERL